MQRDDLKVSVVTKTEYLYGSFRTVLTEILEIVRSCVYAACIMLSPTFQNLCRSRADERAQESTAWMYCTPAALRFSNNALQMMYSLQNSEIRFALTIKLPYPEKLYFMTNRLST